MKIGVISERYAEEKRVALVPSHIPSLQKAGFTVAIESGAGTASGYSDDDYVNRSVEVLSDRNKVISSADILFTVRSAAAAGDEGLQLAEQIKKGQTIIGMMEPYAPHKSFSVLAENKVTAFAMELMPRITRAQSMDVLSSMANLGGYKAALIAADNLPKMFPMMMTAAGTVTPARVFIIGVGVAGLQAIATCRRLGALVSAYDIRPTVKEQVMSLGAKFVQMALEAESAEDSGGYAREMDEKFYRRQRELMRDVLIESDVLITTAAVPGKKSPVLVTEEMVKRMPLGSVIVDLAVERGGNCELSEAGKTVEKHGVKIIGPVSVASSLPFHASQLYSKNLCNFLLAMTNEGQLNIDLEDEIISSTLISYAGELRNENIKSND